MSAFLDRVTAFFARHIPLLIDPESVVAAFIMTFWSVITGAQGGWITILMLFGSSMLLHIVTIEHANYVLTWMTNSWLLLLVVLGAELTFDGLPHWLLAVAGTSVLGYNELLRINQLRRRNAVIHEQVFHAAGLAVGGAGLLATVGIAVAQVLDIGGGRNWLWLPAAVFVLLAIGFLLTVGPTRGRSEADKERWEPGERIPPQPLASDNLEQTN